MVHKTTIIIGSLSAQSPRATPSDFEPTQTFGLGGRFALWVMILKMKGIVSYAV